jgi:predicted RNA-binding Zn ribbon-like protein
MRSERVVTEAGEIRDGFKLRGGHLALDLAATLTQRRREQPRDLLAAPDDLSRWLVAAGLSPRRVAVSEEELTGARELREALYRLAVGRVDAAEVRAVDVALVNRWAAEPPPVPQLGAGGVFWIRAGVRSMLASIARVGVELLGGELGDRIRACSGDGCSLLFLDSSRSGDRRWCSMAACGNRAKVAEFRRRKRS